MNSNAPKISVARITFLVWCISFLFCLNLQAQPANSSQGKITTADLKMIIGEWEGELTYLNYQDNQEITIKADLIVSATSDENQLDVQNIYPDEPSANRSYTLEITENGTLLNKSQVISRTRGQDGRLEIIVEFKGKDAGKKATIRNVYSVQDEYLTIEKKVRFKNEGDWFRRNLYAYKKRAVK